MAAVTAMTAMTAVMAAAMALLPAMAVSMRLSQYFFPEFHVVISLNANEAACGGGPPRADTGRSLLLQTMKSL